MIVRRVNIYRFRHVRITGFDMDLQEEEPKKDRAHLYPILARVVWDKPLVETQATLRRVPPLSLSDLS